MKPPSYCNACSWGKGGYFFVDNEFEQNLKGKSDKLKYYRLNDTGGFEERFRAFYQDKRTVTKPYLYPTQDKIIFTENEIRNFSLDKYGHSLPYIEGELTIFNNYFFDFWGYYLSAEGLALYGHFKRYAYGEKDWVYPNYKIISAKMDKSRPTISKYIDLLERYGFAFQFGVINVTKDNLEESPIFKIRKKIPLLPNRLIYGDPDTPIPSDAPPHIVKAIEKERKGLPPILRKEHEKFVKKYVDNPSILDEDIDFEKVYAAWIKYGEILKKKTKNSKERLSRKVTDMPEMTEREKILLHFIKEEAQKIISKPSFETWFGKISLKIDQKDYIIYAPNEFALDWLKERYSDFIRKCIEKVEDDVENIYIELAK